MKGMIRGLSVVLLVFLVLGLSADDEDKVIEYVWIKGKMSQLAKDSQAVVTLGREEIRTLPVRDVADLLALLPGVHLSRKGPMGAAFDISFRGGNFEQTLIMIDGIPWNNPQTGHFNANLPIGLGEIESLQLIRGGNGARYGSAFAGAVNIVTSRKSGLSGTLSAGQYGLFSTSLGGGVTLAQGLNVQAGVGYEQSNGFHPGTEIRNRLINAALSWENRTMRLNVDFGQNDREFGAAGFYAPLPSWEESDSAMFNLRWLFKGKEGLDPLRLTISRQTHFDYFELDRTRPDYFWNQSATERLLLMVESAFSSPVGELRLGGEFGIDRMESLNMGEPKENRADIYVNGKWGGSVLTIDWGLRGEWWQDRRPGLVYYAGVSYHPLPDWLLKASLGRSTRKPGFTERYYHSPANRGDVGLKPESSQNIEFSLIAPRRFGVLELSVFYRRQHDTIDWIDLDPGTSVLWQAVNLAPFSVAGVELAYALELGMNRLNLSLERIWSRGAPGQGYASKYGFHIPDLLLRFTGLTSVSQFLSISWTYQFKRLMASSESAHLMDLQLHWRLNSSLSLNLLAQNIGNELLEEIKGVRISGRWLSAGIRFRY